MADQGVPPGTVISLTARSWRLDGLLAKGGFGQVFEARADDGSDAVVKLIPKEPGAARELLFESLSGSPNIVPILDSGEWEDYYVLVMPRAEKSLREHLDESGGKLNVEEAVAVLTNVAEALASLDAAVVHRDLKPENILLLDGHWCLADFGIARYAEATTAPDTHKHAMTPRYAAPEQWRRERATNATDVYAFGVMAFELLQGSRPFAGADLRQQHLNEAPPDLAGCPPSLASLVSECLLKPATARPTAANILARLQRSGKPTSPAGARLQEVQRSVVQKQGEEAARLSAQKSREEIRSELFQTARQLFEPIQQTLVERVLEDAPATRETSASGSRLVLQLGDGALVVDEIQAAPADCLAAPGFEPAFDVIAYTAIAARKQQDRYGYAGRAHSLWFCDAHDEGVHRWYELAFMSLAAESFPLAPFALAPTERYAGLALSPVTDVRQIAWEPIPFDQGEQNQFIERWLGWFAAAADGSLRHPSHMPEDSGGKYRRALRHEVR